MSKHLEINEFGLLVSILQYEDEIHIDEVTGIHQIKDLLFFEIE